MKKILSLLAALLISTSAYAGETEIDRLTASGMSLSLANEVDSIYIDTLTAQTLTSPTISGNLTFSTAAAKIIPGATSLTFRNNADSADNLSITDAGNLGIRGNLTAAADFSILQGTSDGADSRITYIDGGGSASATRGAFAQFSGNESGGVGGLVLSAGSIAGASLQLVSPASNGAIYASVNGSIRWTFGSAGTFVSSNITNDIGWTPVNAANQACNTTCTTGCVFGMNTGALGNFVGCADATADTCICAGAS